MTGGTDPEADSPGHRLLAVEGPQLGAEQVAGEAETAALLVEHRDEVVRHTVAVCVCQRRGRGRL